VIRCLAQVLIRYEKCKERPENPLLCELAVSKIGNPWLKREAWDAYVKVDNARKMVDGWLKSKLIRDFFALLSADGAANPRRLEFWLLFAPVIEDVWFVLGANAQRNQSGAYKDMKKSMSMDGRLHYFGTGTTADNNAFVMRIGKFMVVEFGVTGNACYVFNAGDMEINSALKTVEINQLKGANHVTRLLHSDPWEQNFNAWLCPRIDWWPNQRSSSNAGLRPSSLGHHRLNKPGSTESEELIAQLRKYNLPFRDNRDKGGVILVDTDQYDPVVSKLLLDMGFKFSARGWWKE
jgi:hypothetical protein